MQILYIVKEIRVKLSVSFEEKLELEKAWRTMEPIKRPEFGDESYLIKEYSIFDIKPDENKFLVELDLRSWVPANQSQDGRRV